MGGFTPPSPGQAEDWELGQTIAIVTLFGLVGAQWALEQFEGAVANHRHVLTLLRHTYRELMLVGLISLLLYVFEAALNAKNEDVLYSFESTHLLLLVAALCYLALSFALVGLSLLIARQWEALERRYAWDDAAQAGLLAECAALKAALGLDALLLPEAGGGHRKSPAPPPAAAAEGAADGASTSSPARCRRCACTRARRPGCSPACALPWWLALAGRVAAHPVLAYRFYRQLPALRFLQQRTRFIATHGLPPQFSFAVYLRKSKQQAFVSLIEVPLSAWMILGFCVTLDLFVRSISPVYAGAASPPVVISAGSVVVIAASLGVYVKVNRAHWATLHGFYDGGSGGGRGGGSFRDLTSLQLTTEEGVSGGGGVGFATAAAAAATTPATPAPAGAEKDEVVAVTVATPPASPPPAPRSSLGPGSGLRALAAPPPPHRPEELFWFSSPLFLLRLLQGTVFASALVSPWFGVGGSLVMPCRRAPPSCSSRPTYIFFFLPPAPLPHLRRRQMVALLARFWYVFAGVTVADPYAWEASPGATYAVAPILVAVSLACVLLLTRHVVPLYVIILHTGDDVDMGLLIEAVEKQRAIERGRRRQAHARALHEQFLAAYGPPSARPRARAVMGGRLYSALITSCVVADVFLVALLVSQWMPADAEQRVFLAQVALTALLFVDQAARIAVDRRRFFVGPHGAHNVSDALVSTAALASSLTELGLYYAPGAAHDVSGGDDALRVSIITALRLLRLFVVIKLPGCGGGGSVGDGGDRAGCCSGDDATGGVVSGADAGAHHHARRLSAAGSGGAISRGSSFLSLYDGGGGDGGGGGPVSASARQRGSLILAPTGLGSGDGGGGAGDGVGLPDELDVGRAGIASIAAAYAAADAAAVRARAGMESERVVDSGSYDTLRAYAPLWSLLHQLQLVDPQHQHPQQQQQQHRGGKGGSSAGGTSALPLSLGMTPAPAAASARRVVLSVTSPVVPSTEAPAAAPAVDEGGAAADAAAAAAADTDVPHSNPPAPDPDATASDPRGHVTLTLSSELAGALAAQLMLLQREAEAGATTLRGLPPQWLAAHAALPPPAGAAVGARNSGRHLTPSVGSASRPALRDIFTSGSSGSGSGSGAPATPTGATGAAAASAETKQMPSAVAAPVRATEIGQPASQLAAPSAAARVVGSVVGGAADAADGTPLGSDHDGGARALLARLRVPGGGGGAAATGAGSSGGSVPAVVAHHDPFADTILRLRSAHRAAEKVRRREARTRDLQAQAAAAAGGSPRTPPTPIEHSRSMWLPGAADGHSHHHSRHSQEQQQQPQQPHALQAAQHHGGSASMPHLPDAAAASAASVGSLGVGGGGLAPRSRQGSVIAAGLRDAVFEEDDESDSDVSDYDFGGSGGNDADGGVLADAVQHRSRAGSLVQHHVVVAAPPHHAPHSTGVIGSSGVSSTHHQPVSMAAPSDTPATHQHHAGGSAVARATDAPPLAPHPGGAP
jgi:hypothetical protein